MPSSSAEHPLPPCPEPPNCVRTSKGTERPPDRVYEATLQALDALGPVKLHVRPEKRRAWAVYRVAVVFKDDVHVAVEPLSAEDEASVLHVRSASRVGYYDVGVNRRRVKRLFRTVRKQFSSE